MHAYIVYAIRQECAEQLDLTCSCTRWMDDALRTDRQRDRQIDRLRDRSPTTTTTTIRFRGCPAVAGENPTSAYLIVQRARNRFPQMLIQTAGRGEHVQVQFAGCRCRTAGRRARGVVERRACIPGVSLSLGPRHAPRFQIPVQSLLPTSYLLLPSSSMARAVSLVMSGQVSEGGAGGARVKQDLRLLFEAAGSGPVSG